MRPVKLLVVCCVLGLLAFAAQAEDNAGSSQTADQSGDEHHDPPSPAPASKGPAITVDSAAAAVSGADGKSTFSSKADFGKELLSDVKLGDKDTLEVTFKPAGVAKPQQAMIMLSGAHGLTAYAIAKAKKDGPHTVSILQSAIDKQIGKPGGVFKATLLLGDPSAPVGLQWELGTVQLPEGDASKAGHKFLTATAQPLHDVKPEIIHQFRAPEKRPPAPVSLAFTLLALAPLAGLVIALGLLGVNFQGMPTGQEGIWVVLFHSSIAAMLALYLTFWLQLNLAQTLPLALLLGLAVAGTGYKALSATASARLGTTAASSKAAVVADGKKVN